MPKFERIESMLGSSYLAAAPGAEGVVAGSSVFLARFPQDDLAEFGIQVCQEGELLHVIFIDKEVPAGFRGNGGRPGCPGFEVKFQAADLSVIDAHFVK